MQKLDPPGVGARTLEECLLLQLTPRRRTATCSACCKLRSTADGDGTLLDHVTLIYGAGMSDGNAHDPHNLPILLVGAHGGQGKGGRHIRYPEGTPLANLHLTVLARLGVRVDRLGDSTGELNDQFKDLSAI